MYFSNEQCKQIKPELLTCNINLYFSSLIINNNIGIHCFLDGLLSIYYYLPPPS